jgi:hypothetical protein
MDIILTLVLYLWTRDSVMVKALCHRLKVVGSKPDYVIYFY